MSNLCRFYVSFSFVSTIATMILRKITDTTHLLYSIFLLLPSALSSTVVSGDASSTSIVSSDVSASSTSAGLTYSPITYSYQPSASRASDLTTTVSIDCPATVTMTVYLSQSTSTTTVFVTPMPSHYTTAASACTGTSASCPCASNYQCQELSPCTWACNAYTTPTTLSTAIMSRSSSSESEDSSGASSTRSITSTFSVTPVPTSITDSASPTVHPPYATGGIELYLPCVPRTFICTSDSTGDTCDYNSGSDAGGPSGSWIYDYPRKASAGMECITFLSPYSNDTSQYAQQVMAPDGYYRDDRIVRARPDGDCSDEGAIMCTDGGQMFDVCDQGGWVQMGNVANGTTCQDGQIVASGS